MGIDIQRVGSQMQLTNLKTYVVANLHPPPQLTGQDPPSTEAQYAAGFFLLGWVPILLIGLVELIYAAWLRFPGPYLVPLPDLLLRRRSRATADPDTRSFVVSSRALLLPRTTTISFEQIESVQTGPRWGATSGLARPTLFLRLTDGRDITISCDRTLEDLELSAHVVAKFLDRPQESDLGPGDDRRAADVLTRAALEADIKRQWDR